MSKEIKIASAFSVTPGGRYRTDGPFSGEEFREDYLIPAVLKDDKIVIFLDGARGYPSSFLEEAFGGLMRKLKWTPSEFNKKIEIVASRDYEIYKADILDFVQSQSH